MPYRTASSVRGGPLSIRTLALPENDGDGCDCTVLDRRRIPNEGVLPPGVPVRWAKAENVDEPPGGPPGPGAGKAGK